MATAKVKTNNAETLVDFVYAEIKKDLVRGYFKPGQKLIFRELAERYSVSETPVKQALNRLVSEQLVITIPQCGMRIQSSTQEDFKDTMTIRYVLESYFAPVVLATVSFRGDVLQQMQRSIDLQREAVEHIEDVDSFIEYYQLDHEFHRMYAKCAKNKAMVQVLESMGTHAFSNYLFGKRTKEQFAASIHIHERILDALKEQDLDALQEALHAHMEDGKSCIEYIHLDL